MKDRFRFRAWDKLGKKMLFSNVIQEPGESINSFLAFEYPYSGQKHKYMGWNEIDLCIMQCTGTKDKDGKLVFEGDILKIDDNDFFLVVEWDDINGSWELEIRASDNDFASVSLNKLLESPEAKKKYWRDYAKVVGNIYENRDLLPKADDLRKIN